VQLPARTYTVTLSSVRGAIPLASPTARTVFTAWGVPPQSCAMDALLLITTELVANTVRHAGSRHFTITFTADATALG
jgi:hypothetical protein